MMQDEEVNQEGNLSRVKYLEDPQLAERVRSLDMPALIIQGEKDLRPNWSSEQVAQLLPNARYAVIQDAEHCLWLTHPQELRNLLRDFLREILLSLQPSSY
jgi:proline iminopeptidase